MSELGPSDAPTAAERRLVTLLALLRVDDPPPDNRALRRAVMRAIRWQLLVRRLGTDLGNVVVSMGQGILVLAGLRRTARGNRP